MRQKLIIRFVRPPSLIRIPARVKKGIAVSKNDWELEIILVNAMERGRPAIFIEMRVPPRMLRLMGTPITRSRIKDPNIETINNVIEATLLIPYHACRFAYLSFSRSPFRLK